MIRFLLNEQAYELEHIAPELTVLEWLRTNMTQRGTKEGCASGDCGACTVVIAEPNPDRSGQLSYRAINSCITFVASLHGKQLITVEHLAVNGQLHPVQQAMVEHHGSQCGFCTPGFVMSLFALFHQRATPDREQILRALGGNLCRCTGYRPIVDAALALANHSWRDAFSLRERETYAQLIQISSESIPSLQQDNRYFFLPRNVAELTTLQRQYPEAQLVAGSSDLALAVTQQLQQPEILISTTQVKELHRLIVNEQGLEIGAAVTLTELIPIFTEHLPECAQLLERFAATQVRNQATLAGNIANASPIGDMPPVLLALGAHLTIRNQNQRQSMPLDDFFLGYKQTSLPQGALIESIQIPLPRDDIRRVYKVSKRFDDDISAVCGAFCLTLDKGCVQSLRIAFGGMAAIPARAHHCEQILRGNKLDEALIEQAARALSQDYTPMDDLRASAQYRLSVAQNLLRKALYYALEPTRPLEIQDYA
ncbi:xanthine dehydrogenase small subunit [Celerinatantimonas sp. YJH-8]|uniref:xanthine dehydrogenase small subunit n=1 Tax=Celerinatantimonas sp. YJH-8 TaxID=3228714 RepID=UPI0038C722AE